ncbi:MAG: transcriptional regulator [Cyanobacteria bacterium J06621_8]
MDVIQKSILVVLHSFFEQNKKEAASEKYISNKLQINIYQVRVSLKELEKQGYIKLINVVMERITVSNITSEGRLAIKDNL